MRPRRKSLLIAFGWRNIGAQQPSSRALRPNVIINFTVSGQHAWDAHNARSVHPEADGGCFVWIHRQQTIEWLFFFCLDRFAHVRTRREVCYAQRLTNKKQTVYVWCCVGKLAFGFVVINVRPVCDAYEQLSVKIIASMGFYTQESLCNFSSQRRRLVCRDGLLDII